MKRLILFIVVAAVAWNGYFRRAEHKVTIQSPASDAINETKPLAATSTTRFTCDGRTHCSEMSSCAEATFFVKHCPGTKMDGDRDGIPCETQWCRR